MLLNMKVLKQKTDSKRKKTLPFIYQWIPLTKAYSRWCRIVLVEFQLRFHEILYIELAFLCERKRTSERKTGSETDNKVRHFSRSKHHIAVRASVELVDSVAVAYLHVLEVPLADRFAFAQPYPVPAFALPIDNLAARLDQHGFRTVATIRPVPIGACWWNVCKNTHTKSSIAWE